MKEKQYKYDAFISYRHCDLDKFVAENLHKTLESYELPENIKEKLNIEGRTFKRLFRDQDELPLSSNLEDPILEALKDSKYLIVICSPRLKDSLWCKKEIQTFKKLRGRENIFCVLIEGEPNESFPEEVLYDEKEVVKNGKKKIEKLPVEPLAADVRGINKSEVLKRIKEEKLRLAAAMCNIDYDDLKQRHKLREQKRKANIAMIAAGACLLFALYTGIMLIKINSQQNVLKHHQAQTLSKKAKDYLKKDNRYQAIKSSYESLTRFNGVNMPYTSEGEYALVESLGVYDVGSSYKAVRELKTEGVASHIKESVNNKYAAIYDESETITLFNTKSLKVINKFNVNGNYTTENSFTFIGDDIFAYINNKGNISLINIKDNKLLKEIKKEKDSYSSVRGDSTGKYLSYIDTKTLHIYNVKDNKEIGKIQQNEDYMRDMYYSEDSNYLFTATSNGNFNVNIDDNLTIHVIDVNEAREINSVNLTAGYIEGILTKDNNAYLLLNNTKGTDFNALAVSYNYIDGYVNWTNSFNGNWGKFIIKSYPEGTNDVAIVNYDTVNVLDMATGSIIQTFNTASEIIGIYSYLDKEIYLVFLSNGSVNYLNMEYRNNIEYNGRFEFNIDKYTKVALSETGFLLIPNNENRVILYDKKSNKNIKEENIEVDTSSDNSIKITDYDKLKDKYHIKNRSLVDKMLYDDKKELLFVSYTNKDLVIYNVKSKKLINKLTNVGKIDKYYGKDIYNRTYIGDLSNSYILDKNYNKVGHIKGLRKVDKDKVIISNESKLYSIKIYTLNDLLKEAKKYLK